MSSEAVDLCKLGAIMEIKGEVEEVRVKTDGTKIVITVDSLEDGVDFGMLVGMQVVIKEE